ncbi:TldD/PmbA family protein [Kordiimonas sediminis]|uniref:TldD/PmbA family protein n=1 Tax=Kordiimonas sediminis TaxID=1735581 RepID=A0A919AS06_9PROT|nr:TldD/PmbA family protein [Kordiimonas sediminis]GHF19201.1 TldD/PmbA family protein [Kordiimonas sediminis]
MAIMTREEAKALLTKVLSYSKAEACECNLDGEVNGNIRYARNTVSTSGELNDVNLTVQSSFGKKQGTASTNEFTDAAIEKVVRASEELARLAPDNPEFMPILGPQEYEKVNTHFQSTVDVDPSWRAEAADASIAASKANNLVSSGYLNDSETFAAVMNSKGLFAYNKMTNVSFTATIRTADGKGSGWVSRDFNDAKKMDTKEASAIAIQKSMDSVDGKAMEPGRYTVIMEPAATVQLLQNMFSAMNQRTADEGRSFLSGKSKEEGAPKNRLGEKMFDERVTIYTDPQSPDAPTHPFSGDGAAFRRTDWIKDGVVTTMPNSRYWAEKTGMPYVPTPYTGGGLFAGQTPINMDGGDESLEDMIKNTRRGVLVTRLWYIRQLDPQSLMYTGLTRDGTFYIENGEIKYPIKNFRFNESPIVMLNNIEALGKPQRINGCMIPPMKLRDFNFSSLSDAV